MKHQLFVAIVFQRLSESFLDKKIDCDAFLDRYIEERTHTHLLKIKSEKLGEMIQQHTNYSTWGGSTSAPNLPPRHASFMPPRAPANTPYPLYNTAMPQLQMPPVSN